MFHFDEDFILFLRVVSLYTPGYPETCYVYQTDLEFAKICLPLPPKPGIKGMYHMPTALMIHSSQLLTLPEFLSPGERHHLIKPGLVSHGVSSAGQAGAMWFFRFPLLVDVWWASAGEEMMMLRPV